MTILLIEDEPLIARQLLKLVQQLEPSATIEGPLTSVQAVIDYLNVHRPDLIIADIQLADGVSFDAFGQLNLNVPIIFTTAYDEYAIRAFKLNSIDYLLKPIDPDELQTALAKYHRWQPSGTDFADQFKTFLSQLNGQSATPHYKRRFMAHQLRQIVSVSQELVACFIRDELIYLYTMTGQRLVTDYKTLDELDELADPAHFFRATRQCLVHLDAVAGYRPHHTGKVQVLLHPPNDQFELMVSKEKAAQFRQWFEG
ncbi:LytR/AlgR family response regulator transcription factor [Spirosoma utsteinense]|uniref:DNA-binding LytR/AlgR family response regulator n=1 Tax=Spirosoma utsteinense TaxID=2585773 RepID=A0ABR6W0Q6_9BACT|nr:LytTR family DNA-binding domain-containing protein [Spirosoma utsteinense]MBC3784531.1 DNA-binding LytR/AlgR family response regulator [Spirosoma utsteinense]MBC3789718.1 DNA-binding LytR/AlgR family response regulator [Spirosoma utsteinense]